MRIERESLVSLVPEDLPPESLIPSNERSLAASLEDRPLLFRSYLWATAIIEAGLRSNVQLPPKFAHFSAGFVAIPSERSNHSRGGFVFGAYVLVRSTTEAQELGVLEVGTLAVPLVVTYGRLETHGCPPHPLGGSSTAWVKNIGGTGSWQNGILTCRHVVSSLSLGSTITLTPSSSHSHPSSATLADIDECTIDASVLEVQRGDWPSGLALLPVQAPAAPGQPVEFEDKSSYKQSGTVLRVFHHNTYAGNLFGQRVITDCHGIPGDSGSLLTDVASNEGVGIYMGTIPDGVGGRDGIFQDLAQAVSFYGLELYR